MGILDEAIREHMELKRQHGAGDSELKKIEAEAFGPAERSGEAPSDALPEAPTEFLAQPEVAEGEAGVAGDGERPLRRESPSVTDLQEPPEAPEIEHEPVAEVPEPLPQPAPEPLPQPEPEPTPQREPEPEPEPAGHSTEERQAIAEQPTEMYDVEGELGGAAPSPSDEDLVEEEIAEPRLGPTDPLAGLEEDEEAEVEVSVEGPAREEDEDDEFWNEQRLSDELDQALEAPVEDEPEGAAEEPEAREPEVTEQHETSPQPTHTEDVLDETPDFLEETPEDDELWFEQKPPKDFDFDD